ncbi:MAG: hypothetical protein EOO88_15715 [Pedobacter sp.]|nr:MAG: hypothetical protein EOO88_15715 [Pedobacter sp.]
MKKVTVLSELRKEFSGLIERFLKVVVTFALKRPKLIFCAMVALMIGSLLLCFTLLRTDSSNPFKQTKVLSKVESNLGEIGTTAGKLQRIIELKAALEVLLNKDSLDKKDSLLMEQMLIEVDKSMSTKKK